MTPRFKGMAMTLVLSGAALIWAPVVLAHAFPQQEEPSVGSVVHESPKQVRIWFDAKLEPVFSTIVVKDGNGEEVSGESKVDPDSQQILEVNLRHLASGKYHVYWKVVAWDGHHTEGDYTFTVKP